MEKALRIKNIKTNIVKNGIARSYRMPLCRKAAAVASFILTR